MSDEVRKAIADLKQLELESMFAHLILAPTGLGPYDAKTWKLLRASAKALSMDRRAERDTYLDTFSTTDLIQLNNIGVGIVLLGLNLQTGIEFLNTFADRLELDAREREMKGAA